MDEVEHVEEPVVEAQAVAVVEHDPEPVAPAHLRLESGHMDELMAHIKEWLSWTKRQVS